MGKKAEQAEKIAKSVVKVAGIVATVGGVILKTVADNKKQQASFLKLRITILFLVSIEVHKYMDLYAFMS